MIVVQDPHQLKIKLSHSWDWKISLLHGQGAVCLDFTTHQFHSLADMLAALHHPAYPAAETLLLSFQRQVKIVKDSGVRHVAVQLLRLPSQYLFSLPKSEEEIHTAENNDAGKNL